MLCSWAGSIAGLHAWASHKLCSTIREGPRLGSAADQSSRVTPQLGSMVVCVPRLPRVTVQPPQTACWLGSLTKQGCRLGSVAIQVLQPGSWSDRTRGYTQQLGSTVSMLLCLGRTVDQSPRSACSLAKDPNQASYKCQCQIGLPNLPLQMDRATGFSLCSGTTASRNVVSQDLSTGCCEPIPFSASSVSQWLSSTDFPSGPCEVRPKRSSQEVSHNTGGAECPTWALFPTGKTRLREILLVWHCAGLGSFSVSAVLGMCQPHPRVLGFLQWCLAHR